jgi:exonuclease SbcD
MYKFAHIADCHLGAQKYPELKKLEIKAFKECLNKCIEEKVDFIIIAGDLFHSNLPDMSIVIEAVGKLKELQDNGIPVYVNYGSHDFSPNSTSIVDVISESGLMKKLFNPKLIRDENGNEKLKLKYTIDKKTKAKLTGISGRKVGLEEEYFSMLDRKSLDDENGFKIFVFHAWIEELLPKFLAKDDGLPLSCLPKGFNYYAGGHRHDAIFEEDLNDYNNIVYPGPLFAGYPKDLEKNARGAKRGFYIVEFDQKILNYEFNEIKVANYEFLPFTAKNKTSNQLYEEILTEIEKREVNNKIVILKFKGQLTGGKTSDINFYNIKKLLTDKGAINVSINHHALGSKEYEGITFKGDNQFEIEKNLLRENTANINVSSNELRDEKGAEIAIQLINIIKQSQRPNEKKFDYLKRISIASLDILGLEGLLDDI